MRYSVVAIEDGMVRLEKNDGSDVYVCIDELPVDVKEGDILHFAGSEYLIDKSETQARRKEVYDKYKLLFKK